MKMPEPALSFGSVAGTYARARPTYPAEAVGWAIGSHAGRVLDLGAGTGKLTAVVSSLGHDVVAVEPDAQMRATLTRALPHVDVSAGSAERIPLPDASVAAVLAGQAYHWFDRTRAMPEIARVLLPGGTLGLLWNFRDETESWVTALSAILSGVGDEHPNARPAPGGDEPWFGPYEHQRWSHHQVCSPDALIDLVRSRSYVITAPPTRQEEIFAAVRRLLADHPALAGQERFELPYVTHVYRAVVA